MLNIHTEQDNATEDGYGQVVKLDWLSIGKQQLDLTMLCSGGDHETCKIQ